MEDSEETGSRDRFPLGYGEVLSRRIDDLKDQFDALEQRVRALEQSYRETYSNVHLHGYRTQEHRETLTKLNDSMQRYTERFDRLNESIGDIQSALKSYHKRIHDLETATNANTHLNDQGRWIIRTVILVVLTGLATTFWNFFID